MKLFALAAGCRQIKVLLIKPILAGNERIALIFIAALTLVIFGNPSDRSMIIGLSVLGFALILRMLAAGYCGDNQIVVSGIYRLTQNPIYLSEILVIAAFCFISANAPLSVVILVVTFCCYEILRRKRMVSINEAIPWAHDYAYWTPRWIPSLIPCSQSEGRSFSLKLAFGNKMDRSYLTIVIVGLGLFYLKTLNSLADRFPWVVLSLMILLLSVRLLIIRVTQKSLRSKQS